MIAQLWFGVWLGVVMGMMNIHLTSVTYWFIVIGANAFFAYLNYRNT